MAIRLLSPLGSPRSTAVAITALFTALVMALGLSAKTSAQEVVLYESGVHYEELLVPLPTNDPDKIEVIEMFSYLCIHCFNFDAAVSEWASRQDESVVFSRIPAIFNKTWQLFAQAFYTAEVLGVGDKLTMPCSRPCILTSRICVRQKLLARYSSVWQASIKPPL